MRPKFWKKSTIVEYGPKKADEFLRHHVLRRNQRSTVEEKIVKFFVTLALRIAIRPVHWRDKRKNKEIVVKAYRKIVSKDFVFIPPAFTFYLVMAFMPITTIILIIVSLWNSADNFLTHTIENFIHINIDDLQTNFFFENSFFNISSSLLVIILSSWIASSGFAKFVFTESHLYNHTKYGGFWMNRLRGIFIVFALSIYIAICIFGFTLVPIVIRAMGLQEGSKSYLALFNIANIGAGFVALYVGFVLLFRFSPRFKLTWRQVHPGAVIATLPTLLFVILFSYIAKVAFNYSRFDVLAPLMTLAAGLFILSYFIYVGLITNAVFYNVHHSRYTTEKFTVSRK